MEHSALITKSACSALNEFYNFMQQELFRLYKDFVEKTSELQVAFLKQY